MTNQKPLTKGYIGLKANNSKDLTFQYNPQTINYSRAATYAKNAAAYADFPNSNDKGNPALEWVRNEPEELQIDVLFDKAGDQDIAPELQKLDDLMAPDKSTGQPQDLVLVLGRADRVRIISKTVVVELFTPDLKPQRARVNLRMTALKSRTR